MDSLLEQFTPDHWLIGALPVKLSASGNSRCDDFLDNPNRTG